MPWPGSRTSATLVHTQQVAFDLPCGLLLWPDAAMQKAEALRAQPPVKVRVAVAKFDVLLSFHTFHSASVRCAFRMGGTAPTGCKGARAQSHSITQITRIARHARHTAAAAHGPQPHTSCVSFITHLPHPPRAAPRSWRCAGCMPSSCPFLCSSKPLRIEGAASSWRWRRRPRPLGGLRRAPARTACCPSSTPQCGTRSSSSRCCRRVARGTGKGPKAAGAAFTHMRHTPRRHAVPVRPHNVQHKQSPLQARGEGRARACSSPRAVVVRSASSDCARLAQAVLSLFVHRTQKRHLAAMAQAHGLRSRASAATRALLAQRKAHPGKKTGEQAQQAQRKEHPGKLCRAVHPALAPAGQAGDSRQGTAGRGQQAGDSRRGTAGGGQQAGDSRRGTAGGGQQVGDRETSQQSTQPGRGHTNEPALRPAGNAQAYRGRILFVPACQTSSSKRFAMQRGSQCKRDKQWEFSTACMPLFLGL
eukprot:364597-Chlamydomonas_euryale.AAC.21